MVLDLLVAALQTGVTELKDLGAFLQILHHLLANVGHEDVCEELKSNSMVVLHHFIIHVFQILCCRVTNDAHLD